MLLWYLLPAVLIGLLLGYRLTYGEKQSKIIETPLLVRSRRQTFLVAALLITLGIVSLFMLRTVRFGLYRMIFTGMESGAFEK